MDGEGKQKGRSINAHHRPRSYTATTCRCDLVPRSLEFHVQLFTLTADREHSPEAFLASHLGGRW